MRSLLIWIANENYGNIVSYVVKKGHASILRRPTTAKRVGAGRVFPPQRPPINPATLGYERQVLLQVRSAQSLGPHRRPLSSDPDVHHGGFFVQGASSSAAQLGYGLSLVGTALMRCEDPSGLLRDMLAAGRGAAGEMA